MHTESLNDSSDASSLTSNSSTENLARDFTRLHIDNAQSIALLTSAFCIGGEDGVLIWLKSRRSDSSTYAMDICSHFGLTPGRVANIVKKLEERDYISRRPDPEDHRRSRIDLTQKGRNQADNLLRQMEDHHRQIIRVIGEDNARHCIEFMNQILSQLERNLIPGISS